MILSTAREFPIRPFERSAFYQVGDIVRYKDYYCTIQKAITGEELERTWGTAQQSYLVTLSIGDPGPKGDPGVPDDVATDHSFWDNNQGDGTMVFWDNTMVFPDEKEERIL